MKKKSKVSTTLLIVFLLFLTVAFGGFAAGIYGMTLINPWFPGVIAVMIAAASGTTLWKIWRYVTSNDRFWVNYLCHLIFTTSLCLFLFYFLNFISPRKGSLHTEAVTVERLYSETHYHSKRVSRRVYTRGAPYKLYYAEVRFADGATKPLSVKLQQFNRLHKGDTIRLNLEKGLFGFPLVRRKGLNIEVPPSSYRRQFEHTGRFRSPVRD